MYITSQIRRRITQSYFTSKNKEAYEVLAKTNPHQNWVDAAESMFGILPEDTDTEDLEQKVE